MGFDLYGERPNVKEGTVKPKEIDWDTATQEEKEVYWELQDKFRAENPGDYFRANVWTWRPIWNFTCEMCPDILTEEDLERGHYNVLFYNLLQLIYLDILHIQIPKWVSIPKN